MVARIRAQATMPLDRATYHVSLSMGQLPLVVVWAVALVDEVLDDVVELTRSTALVVAGGRVAGPEAVVLVRFAAAVAVGVVVAACPSCQASTPPSESIGGDAERGRGPAGPGRAGRGAGGRWARVRDVRSTVGSSMTANVRTGSERAARGG